MQIESGQPAAKATMRNTVVSSMKFVSASAKMPADRRTHAWACVWGRARVPRECGGNAHGDRRQN
ncbi:MAG: hypothetical protein ACYDHX_01520 [Methanothrix sp.]